MNLIIKMTCNFDDLKLYYFTYGYNNYEYNYFRLNWGRFLEFI